MSFAFIREGDSTSHGGTVLACNPANISNGKAIALLGDMVSCPRCGGIFPIVKVKTGLNVRFGGRPVASDGDVTACGAILVASSHLTRASPTGGAGAPIGNGRSVVPQMSPHEGAPYRGRFQLVDDKTRQSIPNHPYTVTSADGRTIQGLTDTNGYTDWLNSHQASSLTFSQPGTSDAGEA